jgi:glycerol-3-phosphate dehydrogenase (NAD(P)+)
MSRISVIGGGAFGTSLAIHCARIGHDVRMWVYEPELAKTINDKKVNNLYLPGHDLPKGITAYNDFAPALENAELVIVACPSNFLRVISTQAAPFVPTEAIVSIVTKGIENETLLLMGEVIEQTMPNISPANICSISGPSFAKEVAQGLPTDVVAASPGFLAARKLQPMLHSPLFRVYTSDDPKGVSLGGSLKNVIAIAAGVSDEYGMGHNARAALITRGLTEMTRLGMAKGANPITFLGLAGIGDLILTCTGDLSRNRTLGRRIAKGEDPVEILKNQRAVAEGFYAAKSAHNLAKKLGVDMPITEQVYQVLYEGKTIPEAAKDLMTREFKNEFQGIIHS